MKKYDVLLNSLGTMASLMIASGVASLIEDSKARLCMGIGVFLGITVFECLILCVLKELREINVKLNKEKPSKTQLDDETSHRG